MSENSSYVAVWVVGNKHNEQELKKSSIWQNIFPGSLDVTHLIPKVHRN